MVNPLRTVFVFSFVMFKLLVPWTCNGENIYPGGNLSSQTYQSYENIITGNPCVVGPGVDVTFTTDMKTYLNKGFSVKAGGKFKIRILDNDGLPNIWEMNYFGNLNQNAEGDYDGDGLTNKQELDLALKPNNVDTDGDGFGDYIEVTHGSNPKNPSLILPPGSYYEYDDLGRIVNITRVH